MHENPYETKRLLHEYLLFHYGRAEEILPVDAPECMKESLGFAVRTAAHFGTEPVDRGLDIGCATGRSTYEMSRRCNEVIGVDFSQSFVDAAETLKCGTLAYERHDEGHMTTNLTAQLPEQSYPERASFERGDAMHLRADLGDFDRVHAANLLCRLNEPRLLLERLPDLVRKGGELILATPCTWLGEFTPPENWPEGPTLDWLEKHLGSDFDLRLSRNEPFLIRETARKFQWTVSEVSVWMRN